MTTISHIVKSLPYHLQIYEILKGRIISGELQAGNRIYENKISQELGVSRSPVREALRILEQDELVILTSNGLMVNPMELEDIEEVYQCRMAVEPFAAKLAASRLSQEELVELRKLVNEARAHHQKQEYNKVIEDNTAFHDIIVQACGNSRLKAIVERIHLLTILSRRAELECYKRNEDYLHEHERVLEALTLRNGDESEKRLREHINNDFRFYQAQNRKISND